MASYTNKVWWAGFVLETDVAHTSEEAVCIVEVTEESEGILGKFQ